MVFPQIAPSSLPVSRAIAARSEGISLTAAQISRFSRHLLLPEVGVSGQTRLRAARILLVGVGGLGSPSSLYLAAAGVGTLGLADDDVVDTTNLQRQIVYADADQGTPKLDAAAARLRGLAPDVALELHREGVSAENVARIIAPYDIVIDGTDNFATRYLVSDACALANKPYIYGSVHRFEGQVSVFYPPHGPCYRCMFPTPPPPGEIPSCAEAGVMGVLPGIVGTLQATEAVKLALGIGEPLIDRWLTVEALASRFSSFRIPKNPRCGLCGDAPTITKVATTLSREDDTSNEPDDLRALVTPSELRARRASNAPMTLIDVRTPHERAICAIEGSVSIPIAELADRQGEISRTLPVVVYCKSGGRSARAQRLLREAGFADVRDLDGGILAWIEAVDPKLPRY